MAAAAAAAEAGRKRPRDPDNDDDSEDDLPPLPSAHAPAPKDEPAWKTALATAGHFSIPVQAGIREEDDGQAPAEQRQRWEYPQTQEERQRYAVFRDLVSRGFRVTGGSKFGADYLIYPGDPTLYHAQFCVRLCDHDAPLLPALLASASRGSHQARKHLLLASLAPSGEVVYTTIGPVEGFG
ncbi:hypothetical protein QBZ16_005144 [Prototheca wickerhamii]|uniref:tRNA-intron lyase n=1 Tax=Prototheca wickerhamii TaxID=3111 RepID=A0AAD9IG09_PROWI|nr:hypothetical protein QBZ16_005144 [Prototheca wickerhamii]